MTPMTMINNARPKTRPFDPTTYRKSDASIAAYMAEALATSDPAFIADAPGFIARARGMTGRQPGRPVT